MPRWRGHRLDDLLSAGVIAALVEVGLRFATLPDLARWAGSPLVVSQPVETAPSAVPIPPRGLERVAAVRAVMRRWPFGDSCLRIALVSGRQLRSLDPGLRVGVRRVDGRVTAHAWLVIAGAALDPRAEVYVAVQEMAPR